ncbi:hypothetical protein F5Y15DRAFT_291948 [Xylariaceae sp. FL0016]|nr:hypothetical protein F5Y15DRAFT_291948 [Xylariaceae sp. FL0016]
MATSREERMQQRMRGAGRHEVADDSFGFVLPVAEDSPPAPSPAPSPASPAKNEPNTSAKRRRLNTGEFSQRSPQPSSSSSRVTRSASKPQATATEPSAPTSDSHDEINEVGHDEVEDNIEDEQEPKSTVAVLSEQPRLGEDHYEAVPTSRESIVSRQPDDLNGEEVTESPAAAPGSGHRRRIRLTSAITQSAVLQRAVMEEEALLTEQLTTSSPLTRMTRKSGASTVTPGALSTRSLRASTKRSVSSPREETVDEIVESSPLTRPPRRSDGTVANESVQSSRSFRRGSLVSPDIGPLDELSSPPDAAGTASPKKPQLRTRDHVVAPKPPAFNGPRAIEEEVEAEADAEADAEAENREAEEINVPEASRTIGRKRPRTSQIRSESPELHSEEIVKARPAKKKRTKEARASPAKQSQPKVAKKKSQSVPRRRSSGNDDGEAIPITVQRYTKPMHRNEDDTEEDILHGEIPFANRSGVNVIDVLSQMCGEVIESIQAKLHEAGASAKDAASRKEFRTKLRALEAFQMELEERLTDHAIRLDTLHSLKKRVRSAHKKKLALRAEIMRIRAEREQVALKMDAVRIRHETANKDTLHQLGLSSAMDDIEWAIENGKTAPRLDAKETKAAELANLELFISKVSGQIGAVGDGGGSLKQIKDFNAFLERTAIALEAR